MNKVEKKPPWCHELPEWHHTCGEVIQKVQECCSVGMFLVGCVSVCSHLVSAEVVRARWCVSSSVQQYIPLRCLTEEYSPRVWFPTFTLKVLTGHYIPGGLKQCNGHRAATKSTRLHLTASLEWTVHPQKRLFSTSFIHLGCFGVSCRLLVTSALDMSLKDNGTRSTNSHIQPQCLFPEIPTPLHKVICRPSRAQFHVGTPFFQLIYIPCCHDHEPLVHELMHISQPLMWWL